MSADPVLAADMASRIPAFATTAVDGVNGKLEAFFGPSDYRIVAGRGDSANTFGIAGSVSAPLGQSFGMQIDVAGASRDGDFAGGRRRPLVLARSRRRRCSALTQFVWAARRLRRAECASRPRGRGVFRPLHHRRRRGLRAHDRELGILFFPGLALVKLGSENRFFSSVDFSFYALDNLKLFVGHRYSSGIHMGAAGAEYLMQTGAGAAYSFFTEGRMGEQRFAAVLIGVRVYFGQNDKSLIQRNREDHAPIYTPDFILSPGGVRRIYQPYPPCPECCLECEG